jgi:hypothetical protein
MILRPGHYYSFWRIDKSKIEEPNYHGDVLSDSWGDEPEPKDRLLWDGDICSGDIYPYEEIYPELVKFINETDFIQFYIVVRESADLKDAEIVDFKITNENDLIVKLDDISGITDDLKQFLMVDPYSQYFSRLYAETNKKVTTVESIKSVPSFSDKKWEIGDTLLYCLIEKKKETTDLYEELNLELLSQRHIKDLREKYIFQVVSGKTPVFKLRETNE